MKWKFTEKSLLQADRTVFCRGNTGNCPNKGQQGDRLWGCEEMTEVLRKMALEQTG
ncbi:MAG: hypothetical protein HFI83_08665 [Eubacterium sp.]|nr:hypothetical protein [Eubacterium sp.]